jgi:hypothetical protein
MKKTQKPAVESSKAVAPASSSEQSMESDISELTPEGMASVFLEVVGNGVSCFLEAGEWLAKCYDKDKSIFSKIIAEAPWMTVDILHTFVSIGLKRIHPEILLYSGTREFPKLLAMSYDEQTKAIEHPATIQAMKEAPTPRAPGAWKRTVKLDSARKELRDPDLKPASMMELAHQKAHGIYQIVIKPGKPMQIYKGFGESDDMQKVRMMKDPDDQNGLVANIQLYEVI